MWVDDPGRWFIAHAATPDILNAARAHAPGTGPPPSPSPRIALVSVGQYPITLVERAIGEPSPSIADALVALILYAGLDPIYCFGACPLGVPQDAHGEPRTRG